MAKKGRPENLIPFAKGVSGNPGGLPAHYKDFNTGILKRYFGKLAASTMEQLDEVIKNPEAASMELLVAKTIKKAVVTSDASGLTYLLDRFLPKPKEPPAEVTVDFSSMSAEQLLGMAGEVLGGLLPVEEKRVITVAGTITKEKV